MIKKLIFMICAAIMLFLTIAAAVQSYPLSNDWMPVYSTYYYYDERGNIPNVYGPFPQYYIAHNDFSTNFHPDDLNHFDEFIGYKDLDVIYPDEGRIDIIRNPTIKDLDLSHLPEGVQSFGEHVYGELPGNVIYRKHYLHEHAWEDNNYNYLAGYNYFTPFSYYTKKPSCTRSCQSISACQYRYGC